MNIRQQILALPTEERLPAALTLIDDLTGALDYKVAAARQKYHLSHNLAVMLLRLAATPNQLVTKQSLYSALYGFAEGPSEKIIDVQICKLRRKLPEGLVITTAWGAGYSLIGNLDLPPFDISLKPAANIRSYPDLPGSRHGWRWTTDDDATLRQMHENGSEMTAIAEELDRSQRSIWERLKVLGLR